MATASVKPGVSSQSFAKLAASQRFPTVPSRLSQEASMRPSPSTLTATTPMVSSTANGEVERLTHTISSIRIVDEDQSSTSKSSEEGVKLSLSPSESSSRVPPSLDGKSTASGTTFGMEEKESLRPDDSASVMAAEEEDLSSTAGSRPGSETGAKAFRDQFHEISERLGYPVSRGIPTAPRGHTSIPSPAPSRPTGAPARSDAVPGKAACSIISPLPNGSLPLGFSQSEPDEKLLEALESPKDRLFLLRLEQEVIEFVRESKEPMLDLPPCNSFCRLLIHKLADYYFLTHFVDTAANSVRVYRTPFCRLPPPLTGISNPSTSRNTPPPPTAQAMKIMRRGMSDGKPDGTPGTSGDGSSKAPSDDGDSKDAANKDKANMTREEREAAYKLARERIFRGFAEDSEEGTATPEEKDRKEMSRSSSSNGKITKSGAGSTKQRNNRDDGFEARSQFNAYYPARPAPLPVVLPPKTDMSDRGLFSPHLGYPMAHHPLTSSMMGTAAVGSSGVYEGGMAPNFDSGYSRQTPQGPQPWQMGSNFAMPPGHQAFQNQSGINTQGASFGELPSAGYHQSNQQPAQSLQGGQMHAINPTASVQQAWMSGTAQLSNGYGPYPNHLPGHTAELQWQQPGPYSNAYPRPGSQHGQAAGLTNRAMPTMASSGSAITPTPYPYGQLPNPWMTPNGQAGQRRVDQHPVPGSFNRNAFNPQSLAFVPGGQPLPKYDQFGKPLFGGHGHGLAMGPAPYYAKNLDIQQHHAMMPPQGGNQVPGRTNHQPMWDNSKALPGLNNAKHTPNLNANSGPHHSQHAPQFFGPNYLSSSVHLRSEESAPIQPGSTLSKWAIPSNLPPKPPAPTSLSQGSCGHGEHQHSLPPFPPLPQSQVLSTGMKNALASLPAGPKSTTKPSPATAPQSNGETKTSLPAKVAAASST